MEQDHVSACKRKLMNYLNTNDRIVSLCAGTPGESQSYKKFWPYEYIPDTVQETLCNVCFEVSAEYSVRNTTFTDISLFFFVICHYDIVRVENEAGLRHDLIAHEIERDFADKDFMGLGRTTVVYNHPYTPVPQLRGRVIEVSLFDISQKMFNKHDWTSV